MKKEVYTRCKKRIRLKNTIQDQNRDITINGKEDIIQDIMKDLKNDIPQNEKKRILYKFQLV